MDPTPAPSRVARLRAALFHSWALRSLAANGVAWALDYTTLHTLKRVIGLPTMLATFAGLTVGLSTSFLLNRRFAFRDTRSTLGGAVIRYVIGIVPLMLIHSGATSVLVDRVGLPLLAGKLLADGVLMAGGQLLLLRYFVFPRNKDGRSDRTAVA